MRLNEIEFPGLPAIDGYGAGFFRIAGQVHKGAQLILPSGISPWAGLKDTAPLLDAVGHIDVLFLGMGGEIAHPPAALSAALQEAGLGLEVMATPTACRTYNILLSEGRRIGAALLTV